MIQAMYVFIRGFDAVSRSKLASHQDVRKCLWSLQHVMRESARHRASFGMTIENSTTRVWFCCRSVVIVSKAFNLINVRVFYLFSVTINRHEWTPNMLHWNTIRSLKM